MNNIMKIIMVSFLGSVLLGCAYDARGIYTKAHFRSFCGVLEEPTCTDWKDVCIPFEKVLDVGYLSAEECRTACYDMRTNINFNTKYSCQKMTAQAYGLCTKYCNANFPKDNKIDE